MITRRTYLALMGSAATVGLSGCLGQDGSDESTDAGDRDVAADTDADAERDDDQNTSEQEVGPPIDDPEFVNSSTADEWLADGDPVFGVERDGEAKAYPQQILVWHEIVNGDLAGDRVAVTCCPLTGTAQGFARGRTEFGVSGQLLNSNLIMYDRGTESYWPQMLAVGITGPHEGDVLQEFPVTWTTWGRWRDVYPDTAVLSTDTGFARNYDQDPYGSYNPSSGHYDDERLPFSPYSTDNEFGFHPKRVVLGARSADGALAVLKDSHREETVLETSVGDVPYLIVYEPSLDTGYVYRNPDGVDVTHEGERVVVDEGPHHPAALPLDRVLRYDAMWFAWHGYYPDTEVVG